MFKYLNCFIDLDGNVFKNKTLIDASKDLEVFNFDISPIDTNIKLYWYLNTINDFIIHFNKVKNSDLSIPIILRSDNFIMDGYHRVIKAKLENINIIPARKFKIDPKPDFRI